MIRYGHDTRTLQPGDYYVAIRGERYDGHNFIAEALNKGAAGLVVERDPHELPGVRLSRDVKVLQVDDSTTYLAQEARARLASLGCDVVAITGSVGKTTTRRAVVTVLEQTYTVVTTQGNWNTLLGLSLTVLNELTSPEQKFVAEIGIYHAGEISHVCQYIQPTISVVLNVQPVHLETMGTIENIARAKGELVDCLPPDGIACLNYDDQRVRAMHSRCRGRVLYFGTHPDADIRPERITTDIPLLGDYKTQTGLAALAVASCFDMPNELINQGLARLTGEKGRLMTLPGVNNTTLIDDTYNASLSSSLSALEVLRRQPAVRHVAFLGDMLELGSEESASHRVVLTWALEVAEQVILVGPRFAQAAKHLNARHPQRLALFPDAQTAAEALSDGRFYRPAPGDLLLFKGSAGVRMERLVAHFLSPDLDPAVLLVRQEASWQ